MTALKKAGLLRTYYRDRLRGYRLGIKAKSALLDGWPERFTFCLTGDAETNRLKSEANRRFRLHRLAETYITMGNAGVLLYPDEKPKVFAQTGFGGETVTYPAFYSSREVKELGADATQIRSSRFAGVLLVPTGIFVTYNSGSALMKWRYKSELRVKTLLWNILCQQRLAQELMAQLFVDVIIKNTINNGKGDHFWDSCEMNLLKALVLYVDQSYAEQNRNIGEVYRLLTLSGESDLDSLFENLPPTHPAKAPYSLYKQASDTVRSGVIIGLGSRLQVFQSELIKKITTRDEIDLELPGQERCAYFLVTSDQDSTFDFLASLFLSFCFIKLVRYADKNCEGGKLPVPVHVLGEELTACGTIPDLSRRLSVIRSRNISMSCVFQNLAGLQNRYPLNLWQEILGNCDAQLFLGCTDELTAEFISSRTGLASVSVSSKSKQLGTWRISNYTPEYRETSGVGKRPVLTPDEVLRLPIKQALVIIRGQKVLKVDKMDYSKHPEASKLRSCKASAHIPEWRRLEQEQPKPSAAQPKPQAPAPKKPVKKKPKAASTSTNTKQTAAVPTAEAPNGIITTDKDSILS